MTDPFEPTKPPAFVSSVRIESSPSHDYVSVWVQGGKAGTLVVGRGQGERLAAMLEGKAGYVDRYAAEMAASEELDHRGLDLAAMNRTRAKSGMPQLTAVRALEMLDAAAGVMREIYQALPDVPERVVDVSSEGEARAKPPLGLMPEWLWREKRIADIRAALKRLGNRCPNPDYVSELTAHCRWLDEYRAFASLPCTPNAVLTIGAEYVPAFTEGPLHVGPFPPALRIIGQTPHRLPPKVKLVVRVNPSDHEAAAADMPRMVAKLQELGAAEVEIQIENGSRPVEVMSRGVVALPDGRTLNLADIHEDGGR